MSALDTLVEASRQIEAELAQLRAELDEKDAAIEHLLSEHVKVANIDTGLRILLQEKDAILRAKHGMVDMLVEQLAAKDAELEAWKAYALHQETCVDCGETICNIGNNLGDYAKRLASHPPQSEKDGDEIQAELKEGEFCTCNKPDWVLDDGFTFYCHYCNKPPRKTRAGDE